MRWSLACWLLLDGCSNVPPYRVGPAPRLPAPLLVAPAVAGVTDAPPQPCGDVPRELGRVADAQLNEISGVVESRRDPRVLFVHNDSGDSPRFFAVDRAGQVLAELRLQSVPVVIDAEDIAIGPAGSGASFLYLGDTGNNFASWGQGIPRRKAVLYRVREPSIPLAARGLKVPLDDVFPIVLTFPKGARDVEAFFIDPTSGALFMLSKQRDGRSQLLSANAAMLAAGGGELTLVGELRFGQGLPPGATLPTSASISRDGSSILVRTYASVLLFSRAPGESILTALSRAPRLQAAPDERQGEAIAFVNGDAAFVTISEGVNPAINCAALRP